MYGISYSTGHFGDNNNNSMYPGAQCNEEIVENIRWTRTKATENISVPCPYDAFKPVTPENINNTGTSHFQHIGLDFQLCIFKTFHLPHILETGELNKTVV